MKIKRDKRGVLKVDDKDPLLASILTLILIYLVEVPVNMMNIAYHWCAIKYYQTKDYLRRLLKK